MNNLPDDHKACSIVISDLFAGEMFGFIDIMRPDKKASSKTVHMGYVPMGHYSYTVTCMSANGEALYLSHYDVIKKLRGHKLQAFAEEMAQGRKQVLMDRITTMLRVKRKECNKKSDMPSEFKQVEVMEAPPEKVFSKVHTKVNLMKSRSQPPIRESRLNKTVRK